MKIDTNSLANLLRGLRAATIVGLYARTVPAMRKTHNPYFGRIVKLCRLTAVIGASYGSAVNRRRVKEAAQDTLFTASFTMWGTSSSGRIP